MSEPTTRIFDLSDYWNMVRARRWVVVVTAVVVAALSATFVLLKPDQYYAPAKVVVTPLIDPAVTPSREHVQRPSTRHGNGGGDREVPQRRATT